MRQTWYVCSTSVGRPSNVMLAMIFQQQLFPLSVFILLFLWNSYEKQFRLMTAYVQVRKLKAL